MEMSRMTEVFKSGRATQKELGELRGRLSNVNRRGGQYSKIELSPMAKKVMG
jgi:hypothetical protein